MKIYKEEAINSEEQFTTRTLINNVDRAGCMVSEHWHDYYEILYIMDGQALQTIESRAEPVAAGDLVLIQPGEVHATYALSENGCGIMVLLFFPSCLNFDNHTNLYSRYLNLFLSNFQNRSGYLHSPYPYEQDILKLICKINEEYTLQANGFQLITKGLIYQLLGFLQRIGNLSILPAATQSRYLQVIRCCRYIEDHYMDPLTLEEVAGKLGYSKEHFSRLFKECVGENYKAFVDYVRVSQAKRMIKYEGLSISETAERVGYQNLCSFSRAFKRMTGHPPTMELAAVAPNRTKAGLS